MREEYIIQAYSPTLNQTVRQFDLSAGDPSIHDLQTAQQVADMFAIRLNQQMYLKTTDWQGRPEWQQLGIETLDGFLFQQ